MIRALTAAFLVVTVSNEEQQTPASAPAAECVRLSGPQIGALPLTFTVGGQTVALREWKATDITASELIGFTATAPESVRFEVEAGGAKFDATSNWLHPAGVIGPQVKPIAAITVCAG